MSAQVQRVEFTSCTQLPSFLQTTTEQLTASDNFRLKWVSLWTFEYSNITGERWHTITHANSWFLRARSHCMIFFLIATAILLITTNGLYRATASPTPIQPIISKSKSHSQSKNFFKVLFVGPLIPLFWTSGNVSPGFQSQGGSLTCVLCHLCAINSEFLRFTSSGKPADCIEVSMAAKPFRSRYLQMYPQALVEFRGSNPRPSVPHAASTAL